MTRKMKGIQGSVFEADRLSIVSQVLRERVALNSLREIE